MAVTWASIGALATGTSGAEPTPTLASGIVADSIALALITVNKVATASPPTDYTQAVAATGTAPTLLAHWHRATGSESGTITVPHDGDVTSTADAFSVRVAGAATSGSPIGAVTDTGTATGVTTDPLTITGTTPGSLLVWVVSSLNSRTVTTPPTGFTVRDPNASQRLHLATMENPSGGDHTALTALMSSSSTFSAVVFEILPPSGTAHTGDADLANTATLTSAGTLGKMADSALAVTATLASAAILGITGNTDLAVTATTDATATRGQAVAADLPVTATLTASATVGKALDANLPITATLTADASDQTPLTCDAELPVTATLSSTATVARFAASTLPIIAGLDATATVSKTANANLAAIATFTAGAGAGVNADAALAVTATLTAEISGQFVIPDHPHVAITSTTTRASIRSNNVKAVIS